MPPGGIAQTTRRTLPLTAAPAGWFLSRRPEPSNRRLGADRLGAPPITRETSNDASRLRVLAGAVRSRDRHDGLAGRDHRPDRQAVPLRRCAGSEQRQERQRLSERVEQLGVPAFVACAQNVMDAAPPPASNTCSPRPNMSGAAPALRRRSRSTTSAKLKQRSRANAPSRLTRRQTGSRGSEIAGDSLLLPVAVAGRLRARRARRSHLAASRRRAARRRASASAGARSPAALMRCARSPLRPSASSIIAIEPGSLASHHIGEARPGGAKPARRAAA